jgi:ABC-2 type transport system permease protein
MIPTLLRISWTNLRRDRVAQSMSFGNQRNPMRRITVAVADEDESEYSTKLVEALRAESALQVRTTTGENERGTKLDRSAAEKLIKNGALSVAIVLPKGLGAAPRIFTDSTSHAPKVQLLADVSDPIAPQMVQGLLQKVSFTAVPESLALEGMSLFEKYGGPLTIAQRRSADTWVSQITGGQRAGSAGGRGVPFGLAVEVVNVMQPGRGDAATVSFYAAGIGVMFLLFSSSAGGGTLLEEEEAGTLGRLISSNAGMTGVLAGKWLFLTLMGIGQLSLMFVWGALVFGLPLASHLPGFFVMTCFTAAAAAAFGLVLATLSRSRQQLAGISTILVLTMSALGGSMFPRFLMSPAMQKVGLVTFNAWALDGYIAVFWREAPVHTLWPQVLVLVCLTLTFLTAARVFARRWETL